MKKGHMNKRFVHSFILLLVFAFAIGIVFFYSNIEFTGLAILSQYPDQTSCESAGYVWETLTEENCTTITNCVNETADCEPCLTYEDLNGTQGDCTIWTQCTNEVCTDDETCEDIVLGGQCTGNVCGTDHLELCSDETSCTSIGKYWYNSVCNAEEAQCVPATCESLSYSCGSVSDGCGESLNCGSCSEGLVCNSGVCETEDASSESSEENSEVQIPVTAETVESTPSCTPNWQCDETWGECTDGTQIRTCVDTNQCGSEEGIPATSQPCTVEIKESCSDGIKNQDETGIDCGGSVCNKCSFFTIAGSAVSGTIEVGRKFILEGMFGNLTKTMISVGILVFVIGGIVVFVLFKKKVIKLPLKQVNPSKK